MSLLQTVPFDDVALHLELRWPSSDPIHSLTCKTVPGLAPGAGSDAQVSYIIECGRRCKVV